MFKRWLAGALALALTLAPVLATAQTYSPVTIGADAQTIWRNYNTINVSSSGLYYPVKSQISQLLGVVGIGLGSGVAVSPGTETTPSNAGTGYAAGDQLTLACSSVSFSTAPKATVTTVNGGGGITNWQITVPGYATSVSAGAGPQCSFTVSATTGSGSGAVLPASFGPIASMVSWPILTTGGGASNGNTFSYNGNPNPAFASSESTYYGAYAGDAFVGAGAFGNSAFGEDACGGDQATYTSTGGGNTCIGNDAGRNASSTFNANTLIGQDAGRNFSGGGNTVVGWLAGMGGPLTPNSTNANTGITAIGAQALTVDLGNNDTAVGQATFEDIVGTTGTNSNCTAIGFNTGRGVTTCSDVTIVGALVSGLPSTLSNAIILSAGNFVNQADYGYTQSGAWTLNAKTQIISTTAGQDAIVAYSRGSSNYFTIKPEASANAVNMGYWLGSSWGTITNLGTFNSVVYQVSGTTGVTGGTCSHWTSGLCTSP